MLRAVTLVPTALITTSRKTSNRVRSFARDLWTVFPDSERFNRGGMGLKELAAKISHSGARIALIISMFKGNPREIQFMDSSGTAIATLILESATLRREVAGDAKFRVEGIASISVAENSSQFTKEVAGLLSLFLGIEILGREEPLLVGRDGTGFIEHWFSDLPGGKVLWTIYHSVDAQEIGPRIRILRMKR